MKTTSFILNRIFRGLGAGLALWALSIVSSWAATTASATIAQTGSNPNQYTITLTNTGTTAIETFWFSWVPGEDFMTSRPLSVTPPSGWNSNITNGGSSDGFAIQFVTSSTPVQPGQMQTFIFTSADTFAQVTGNSVFYPSTSVLTSFVYQGAPFSGGSQQFLVTASGGGGSGNDPSAPIVGGSGFSPTAYQNIAFSGNIYDVVLLNSPSVTVTVKPGHITRVSFIDPNNNICFVECGGSGSFTVSIPNPTIASPVNYNQPSISYAKGLATTVVNGNNTTTFVSIFSLGTDPTRVDPSLIVNPGAITGIANTQSFSVTGAAFGGINLANDQMSGSSGAVGISAPSLTTTGSMFLGNMNASSTATPLLQFASGAAIPVEVSGGAMQQTNAMQIQCSGVASVTFVPGMTATTVTLPKGINAGQYLQNGQNVTSTLVH